MSEMYKRIETLCKKQGITITQMCKDANVSRGSLTDLKMGRSSELSTQSTIKLSEYFGVSADYILGKSNSNNVKAFDENDNLKFALYGTTDIDDDIIQDVRKYAEVARRIREEHNGQKSGR